jgi:hypothetical protein
MTPPDVEPVVTLRDGTVVDEALYRWVADLLDAGHVIVVLGETVRVDPPCDEDVYYHIWASRRDTFAILVDLGAPPEP